MVTLSSSLQNIDNDILMIFVSIVKQVLVPGYSLFLKL